MLLVQTFGVFGVLLVADAAPQVCRQVWDDTVVLTVICNFRPSPSRYVCPADGRPCEALVEIGPPVSQDCGRATKTVCGPPEKFEQR